jgi:predicted RNase H-like HicB family nuclease
MKYAVLIEKTGSGYSAYIPDLPGCVATGATAKACREAIGGALRMHLQGMREDGLDIPEPSSLAEYVVS